MARIDQPTFVTSDPSLLLYMSPGSLWLIGEPETPVVIPPYVTNVTPATSVPLYKHEPVSFDVLDDGSFRRILITARFTIFNEAEVVHDGDNFTMLYAAGSTKTAIAGGYHFVLLRSTGWPSEPRITPYAFDTTGQENT